VPCICKVAPSGTYLMEDVHRAGGIPAILGELCRGGLLNEDVHTVHSRTIERLARRLGHPQRQALRARRSSCSTPPPAASARPRRSHSQSAGSRLTLDAAEGCIHDVAHAYSQDGGLAILYGNLAVRGSVVKTAGVDESILDVQRPGGRGRVPGGGGRRDPLRRVKEGDVVVIRYEGPRGGPGMQEMLYPTSYLKGRDSARPAR
jgi:dihydroxy-acid dehydratase